MVTYFFSGVDRPKHLALLAAEHASGMVNRNNATQPSLLRAYSQWPQVPLALDSGAPQGRQEREAYLAIVEHVGSVFRWISNLDVIGDQNASNKHFDYLQSHLSSESLRQKLVWVFQTDGSLQELEDMARKHCFVGIGGLVPMLKRRGHEAVLRYLMRVGERLLSVNAQAHVFGLSSPSILFRVCNEPWLASVDSSKWLVAYKASQVLRTNGTGQCRASEIGLCLTPDEMAANNIRVIRKWILPVPVIQLPLIFQECEERIVQWEQHEECYQFTIFLRDVAPDIFFLRFGSWVKSWDGSDEEGEIFFILRAPFSLGNDLIAWCQDAVTSDFISAQYDIWYEVEAYLASYIF